MYIFNESFIDLVIVKVFYGVDLDIEWLQKDFGLYVVNMFDIYQVVCFFNLGRYLFDYFLKFYCNVDLNKQYQLVDWRICFLFEEMFSYVWDDIYYLLYIYDKMRLELWECGNGQFVQLQVVWQWSRDICFKKFIKFIFMDEFYFEFYRK